MKEYNIEALWKEDTAPSSQFTLGYLPNTIKSKLSVFGELKRVRNLFWWQWLIEFALISLSVFLMFLNPEEIKIEDILFSIAYSGIVYYFYISYFIKFIKGINKVPALKIKDAIKSYYDTLCDYIKRLFKLIVILCAIGILVALIDVIFISEEKIKDRIIEFGSIVFAACLTYAIIEGYFDYMYKDSKTEFENLLREFEDE